VALFFCRRWTAIPEKTRTRRFTIEEVEPFITVEYRNGTAGDLVVAAIGVATQKADGRWGTHELSDEARLYCKDPWPGTAGRGSDARLLEVKARLVRALNRLREHYGRIYVYPAKP
jgi:hypothetical protein